jgi:hypothetical protein
MSFENIREEFNTIDGAKPSLFVDVTTRETSAVAGMLDDT